MTTAPSRPDTLLEAARQLEHWRQALERLGPPEAVAPPTAWRTLEHYLGVSLRVTLLDATARLRRRIARVEAEMRAAGPDDLPRVRRSLLAVRRHYLRTETLVDFFADALATRATEPMGSWLRACDHLATRAMTEILVPLGRPVPAVLSFADKGAGAAIWKMGLRLWDGTTSNPVAVIKVTRHNLLRPTATLHEAGHQIAHILGWNEELRAALGTALGRRSPALARVWSGWATEIAGDAIAFCHAGFGAVAALHDVVDGEPATAFALVPGDPHPIGHLRVLLGVAMCRRAFGGAGPWDRMAEAWSTVHPLELAGPATRRLVAASLPALGDVVDVALYRRYPAFGNRPLAELVNPDRVAPPALERLSEEIGRNGFHSRHWIWDEAIRLLALTSYRATRDAASLRDAVIQQDTVMRRLGLQRAA